MARNTQPPEGESVVPGPVDGPDLTDLTVDELQAQADKLGIDVGEGTGAGGNVVKADLVDALTIDVPALEAERQAALADAEAASERANDLHRQILAASGPDELQAAGLLPLITVAEASAAAAIPTPVED